MHTKGTSEKSGLFQSSRRVYRSSLFFTRDMTSKNISSHLVVESPREPHLRVALVGHSDAVGEGFFLAALAALAALPVPPPERGSARRAYRPAFPWNESTTKTWCVRFDTRASTASKKVASRRIE
jgi:hypothetical protein